MSTHIFKAIITPGVGGMPITVSVPANSTHQATKIIESIYKPERWFQYPMEDRKR